ncbi:hypothetical protein N9Z72_00150 [Akkermansiaceae bacterium]|nr:hypothetical protein [Akkermansiaceae bacterium]
MATINRYGEGDVVMSTDKVVTSTWSDNTNNLTTFHTSSIQANQTDPNSQGNFFIEAYHKATSSVDAEVQFSVGYGHKAGSGSVDFTNDTGSFGFSAAKVIYNQYRQLVYGDETQNFTFSTHTPDDIYFINVNRSRYRHNLKPGSLNLKLKNGGATIQLTDDSVTSTGSAVITNVGRQFNLVSGSDGVMLGSNINQVGTTSSYGFVYPDAGLIVLNPDALSSSILGLVSSKTANTNGNNGTKILTVMEAGNQFIVDSEERITSQYYFTRVKNFEFNYSANPSFIDDQGSLNFTSMIDMPRVYISTVGLYNDEGDLLAVAKLSQPVAKDFTKEALIRVKLDY